MTNIKYSKELFNQSVKEQFVSDYSEATQKTILALFRKTSRYENKFRKDLYNFTLQEIDQIYLENKSPLAGIHSTLAAINKYINWSIEKGHCTKENPLRYINVRKYSEKLAKQEEFIDVSNNEKIEDKAMNIQDSIIVRLLFEGVGGKEYSEILNLTIKDVNFNSKSLSLTDFDGSNRILSVSNRCLKMVKQANVMDKYQRPVKKSPSIDLIKSDKIIKLANTNANEEGGASEHLVYRRIKSLSKEVKIKFTPKTITRSGMLKQYNDLVRSGVEQREAIKKVCINFGILKNDSNEIKIKREIKKIEYLLTSATKSE